jgi:cephalosporin-C deacetylase
MLEHPFPFDPTYGYTLETLVRVGCPEAPVDFESFWRDTYAQTRAVPARPEMRKIESAFAAFEVYEVEYDSLAEPGSQPFRVGGWVTVPRDGDVRGALVVGHGYGGREGPGDVIPVAHAAAVWPCARGFHRSARPDLPDNSARHVIRGIDSRETYLHRFCVADLWQALTALHELVPASQAASYYAGGSFGGGIGALMLPWEPRLKRAFLDIPSFGNHPLRVTLPCVGSGEAVRLVYQKRPNILETLKYFDSATASTFTTIPTLVAAALFDPAVPPPGQFAVYNALAGPKELFVRDVAHFAWHGEAEEGKRLFDAQVQFFARENHGPAKR